MGRFALGVVLLLTLAGPAGAASPLSTRTVPRGGFTVQLPPAWVDLTVSAKAVSSGSIETVARYVDANGPIKLIAADPTTSGAVYLKVGVESVGATTLKQVVAATVDSMKTSVGQSGSVVSRAIALPSGSAYAIHLVEPAARGSSTGDIYVVVTKHLLYALTLTAPSKQWGTYSGLFERIARSFRILPSPDLTSLILSAAEVGPGYDRTLVEEGDSFIGQGTVDLCGASYPSESLRTGRRQVRYEHAGQAVTVSNEIATYSSRGADEAMREISAEASKCASRPIVRKRNAVTITYSVDPLSAPNLLPGAVAVHLKIAASKGKDHVSEDWVLVYQRHGDTLSGVYARVDKGTTLADAKRIGFHAAARSARILGGTALAA